MRSYDLPFISTITPSFKRAFFLRESLKHFMRDQYPQNRKEWIIIDNTPSTPEYAQNESQRLDFLHEIQGIKNIHYYNIPYRSHYPEAYRRAHPEAFSFLHQDKKAYMQTVEKIRAENSSNSFTRIKPQFADDNDPRLTRPSIGEMRNIGCALAKGDIISHGDDDDYYGPHYRHDVAKQMSNGTDFMRWGDFYVYMASMNLFGAYHFNSPHGCYRVSKAGSPVYISADELKKQKEAGEIRKEGHGYGLLFSYTKDIWKRAGHFAPLFTEEDVVMVSRIEKMGGKISFPKGLTDRACRIIHGNTTSSRVYMIYRPDEVPNSLWQMASAYNERPAVLTDEAEQMRQHLLREAKPKPVLQMAPARPSKDAWLQRFDVTESATAGCGSK